MTTKTKTTNFKRFKNHKLNSKSEIINRYKKITSLPEEQIAKIILKKDLEFKEEYQ